MSAWSPPTVLSTLTWQWTTVVTLIRRGWSSSKCCTLCMISSARTLRSHFLSKYASSNTNFCKLGIAITMAVTVVGLKKIAWPIVTCRKWGWGWNKNALTKDVWQGGWGKCTPRRLRFSRFVQPRIARTSGSAARGTIWDGVHQPPGVTR